MQNVNWKTIVYFISLLVIIAGVVMNWMGWPYSLLLVSIGFTPYVGFKIAAFFGSNWRERDWTDKIRFVLALFMGIMLVLLYFNVYHSNMYFMLAVAIDYIVGKQLSVRRRDV